MGNIASGSTKPFVIAIGGDGVEQERGFVEVNSSHLLGQTRELILKEFDRDMLPCEGDDFYFCCNGVRLSANQEERLRCWDLLDQKYEISIHPKTMIKRKDPSPSKAFDTPILSNSKKPRTRKDAEEKRIPEASEEQRVTSTTEANKESPSTQNPLKQSDAIDNELRSQEECMPNNGGGKYSIFPIESPGIRASTVKEGADKEDNLDTASINFRTPTHSGSSVSLMDTDTGTSDDINPQLITEEKDEVHDHIDRSHSGQNLFKTHHTDFGLADEVHNMQESDTDIKNDDSMAAPCIGTEDGNQDNTGSISEEGTDPFIFTAAESDTDDDSTDMTPEPENSAHKSNEIALKKVVLS